MVGNSESLLIVSMWTSMASWFTPTILFCVTNLIIGTLLIASNNNSSNKNHDDQVRGDSSSRITRVSSFLDRARSINLSSFTTTSTYATTHNLSSCTVTSTPHHEYVSHPPSPSKTPNYSSSSRLAQSIYVAQPTQLTRAPSLLERVKSIKLSSIYNDDTFHTESEQISNTPSQLTRVPSFLDRVKSFKISFPFKQVPPSTQPENVDTYPSDHHIPGDHPPVIRSKSEKPPRKKLLVEIKKSRSEMNMAGDDEDEDVDLRRPATTRERQNVVDEEVDAKADDFISKFKQQLKLQRLESLVRYNQTLKSRQC